MAGQHPAIQLNIDATRMSQAFSGGGYVQNIVTSEVEEYVNRYRGATTVPVDLTLRSRFNPELDKSWFGSINNIITAITMLSIVLTGAALIREREHGTVEHLLVMPVTPLEIMLSKVWSMGLVVLVASAFSLFVVVKGLLAIPIEGSLSLFLLGNGVAALCDDLDGYFPGNSGGFHAAIRHVADLVPAAAAGAVRRHDAARKHAGYHPVPHAARTQHSFRNSGAIGAFQGGGAGCGLAAIAGAACDRLCTLHFCASPLPAVPALTGGH